MLRVLTIVIGDNMKIHTQGAFEAAHRLSFYDGKCNRLHGHNWIVEVDIDANINRQEDRNIVMDFTLIKKVLDKLDHKIILEDNPSNRSIMKSIPKDWIVWLSIEPTAENLATHLLYDFKQIMDGLGGFNSIKIRVWENDHAWAEDSIGDL